MSSVTLLRVIMLSVTIRIVVTLIVSMLGVLILNILELSVIMLDDVFLLFCHFDYGCNAECHFVIFLYVILLCVCGYGECRSAGEREKGRVRVCCHYSMQFEHAEPAQCEDLFFLDSVSSPKMSFFSIV